MGWGQGKGKGAAAGCCACIGMVTTLIIGIPMILGGVAMIAIARDGQ